MASHSRAVVLATSIALLLAAPAQAWDQYYYEPPELVSCGQAVSLGVVANDQCVELGGYLEVRGLNSTADGFIGSQIAFLRFGSLAPSDAGPTTGTVVIQAAPLLDYVSGGTSWSYSDKVLIKEAYATVGDQTLLMVGKKRSVARFDNDEARGLFGTFSTDRNYLGYPIGVTAGAYVPDIGVKLPSGLDLQRLGLSVQARQHISPEWSAFAAIEELDRADGGALVIGSAFDGEQFAGHLTVVSDGMLDGEVDNWGAHGAASVDLDHIDATFAAVMTSSGYWQGLVSAELSLAIMRVAGSFEQLSTGGQGWAASAGVELGQFDLEVGAREHWTSSATARHLAAVLTFLPTETLAAQVEVGNYVAGWTGYSYSTDYLAARLKWEPGGGVRADARHERYSNGATLTAVSVSKIIQ